MLQTIMSALKFKKTYSSDDGNDFSSRRQHPRRSCDQCIGFINGKAHPVLDWSPGGAKIFGDSRVMSIGDDVEVEMRFHLRDHLVQVQHHAKIVRKMAEAFSVEFNPLPAEISKTFQSVIDDFNAREFAGSQV